ncbi:MAG: D-glycero-beta-D-manno-heptose 1,7-bisphosphate 7-phosphatase [Gammaproteobacteria bacterium]
MKLVILDRDGVINYGSAQFIKTPDEWKPIPGSLEAIARLTREGWRVVVATNQSGLARGLFEMATLNAIHAKMHKAVTQAGGRIEAVFYCPHAAEMNCECRKPKDGLFKEIAARYGSDLRNVPSIGDSMRDLQAALNVGAQPLLVRTGKGEKTLLDKALPASVPVFADLSEAVEYVMTAV